MEALLTFIGYGVILVVAFVIAMLKPQSTAGRGLAASLVAMIVLVAVNALTFVMSLWFANIPSNVTAEQVAKELYDLEEKKQYPLVLASPDGNVGKGIVFTIDPGRPLAEDGQLLVRLSLNGKSYELELPQELKQQPSGQASVELEFNTPSSSRKSNDSIYGEQTLVSESPCAFRLTGVLWCEKEQKYKTDFSKELRSLSILTFLKQSLVSATFTVPPDLYRTIKLG